MAIKAGDVIVIDSGKYLVTDLWRNATIYDGPRPEPYAHGQSFRAVNLTNNGGQYDLAVFDAYGDSWIVDWDLTEGGICRMPASDHDEWVFDNDGISNCVEKLITIIAA